MESEIIVSQAIVARPVPVYSVYVHPILEIRRADPFTRCDNVSSIDVMLVHTVRTRRASRSVWRS